MKIPNIDVNQIFMEEAVSVECVFSHEILTTKKYRKSSAKHINHKRNAYA